MNAPVIHREILKLHIAAVEEMYPIRLLGFLPSGTVAHLDCPEGATLEFLAEKGPELSLMDLCAVEAELSRRLGVPVGVLLKSGLKDQEAIEIPKLVEPL